MQGRTQMGAPPKKGPQILEARPAGTGEGHHWPPGPKGEQKSTDLPPHKADLFPGPEVRASPASASRSAPLKTCSCCSLTQPRVRNKLETKPTAAAISGTMSARGPPRRWLWLMLGSRAAAKDPR